MVTSNPAQLRAVAKESKIDEKSFDEKLSGRESREIVIAFSGAVGAGIQPVKDLAIEQLKSLQYEVYEIKVSKIIKTNTTRLLNLKSSPHVKQFENLSTVEGFERYESLQSAGNELRSSYSENILAQLVVAEIAQHHSRREVESEGLDAPPSRVAFIVDQLKHYAEVHLLRRVYENNFFLIGVLASETRRLSRLIKEAKSSQDKTIHERAIKVITRDRDEEELSHGQKLDKTLQLSDFFVRNSDGRRTALEENIRRFFRLIHGAVNVTPTRDEFGMYVAYSSALASACMSRQVGAAILDSEGTVLGTGCNDVPRAGGGLYTTASDGPDHRCVMQVEGLCHNDDQKEAIRKEIENVLIKNGISNAKDISKQIKDDTRLRSLIEFSRSVHAEMDALVSIARKGGSGVSGATLYTTTYPCHNCARHILAAGISRVFFVEPYEKSLALKLHSDAIVDDLESGEVTAKVPFLHFEGVAPRRYLDLFLFSDGRKARGTGIRVEPDLVKAAKKTPQLLDGYRDIEKKILEQLTAQHIVELEPTSSTPPNSAA